MSHIYAPAPQRALPPTLVALLAATIFTSAYLLFQVQPLISKYILPWFGGSPTVWTAAMLFFQCTLFAGYVYAHLLSRHVPLRLQQWLHAALLLIAALLAIGVLPDAAHKPHGDEEPLGLILGLLATSVGLPYFVLSTTGPLLQHWFVRAGGGTSVFRLYALSNVGSFLALLSFPYVFEPRFELPFMGQMWTAGFWVFALMCATVALGVGRLAAPRVKAAPQPPDAEEPAAAPISLGVRLLWLGLPALASLGFIATTDHVSHDIAPEPRLWIATLSLYLLTFILSFDHPRWYRRRAVAALALLSLLFLAGRNEIPGWLGLDWDYSVSDVRWTHLGSMFLVCLLCHGELYRQRPSAPQYLTSFYLWMSLGGACGGLFVALVATQWFSDYHEWPLYLGAAAALAGLVLCRTAGLRWALVVPAGLLALFAVLALADPWKLRSQTEDGTREVRLHQSRNFYGTVSVTELRHAQAPHEDYRVFYSGQITHGKQFLDASLRRLPVTYYGEGSGAGETLRYAQARQSMVRVAVIGLGAGTLANYARPTDSFHFYEINPDAAAVAERWFDNLAACEAGDKQVIIGDARLKFEQLAPTVQYDVIVLDAFTGGAVPIHLLTREAFALYRKHLAPQGFIAINITNGYLNLYPVVQRQAEALGLGYRHKVQPPEPVLHVRRNMYFVMTEDQRYLQQYPSFNRRYYDEQGRLLRDEDPRLPGVPLWTDHFSSLTPIELED